MEKWIKSVHNRNHSRRPRSLYDHDDLYEGKKKPAANRPATPADPLALEDIRVKISCRRQRKYRLKVILLCLALAMVLMLIPLLNWAVRAW